MRKSCLRFRVGPRVFVFLRACVSFNAGGVFLHSLISYPAVILLYDRLMSIGFFILFRGIIGRNKLAPGRASCYVFSCQYGPIERIRSMKNVSAWDYMDRVDTSKMSNAERAEINSAFSRLRALDKKLLAIKAERRAIADKFLSVIAKQRAAK